MKLGDYYLHGPSGLEVRAISHAARGRVLVKWPLGGMSEVPREHLENLEENEDEE